MEIGILIVAALACYTVWALRRISLRRKQTHNHCSACPHYQSGQCGGKEDKIEP